MAGPVRKVAPLGFPFDTPDPFLFCVYHKDDYPAGDAKMQAPRRGNGADFDWSAPYRMYHGSRIPGFPLHPHRGFETLTITLEGLVDHADSLGASGRYGQGDLQWMSAGSGVQHQEMFPLVHADRPNHLKLYQVWLNLPAKSKLSPPQYRMIWAETLGKAVGTGGATALVYAGQWGDVKGGTPPPHSWAVDPANEVGAFVVQLPPGGSAITLPPAQHGAAINRVAYLVTPGAAISVGGQGVQDRAAITLRAEAAAEFRNEHASTAAELLVLQGRPIGEPVAQRGPFVMNTQQELMRTFAEYQATQFGGWPWPQDEVVFPRERGRFASFVASKGAQPTTEYPPGSSGNDSSSSSGAAGGSS